MSTRPELPLTRLSLVALACATPALVGWPGVIESAAKNVKSAVVNAPALTRAAFESGKAAVGSVVPKGWTEKKWKEERVKAKEESKGLEQYHGPRYQIRAKGTEVACMPMKAESVEPKVAFIIDNLLLTELADSGFNAIGPDDINDMLGFETMKDKLGSEEPTNLSEIGAALGVKYLTAGSVAVVEGSLGVSLKLIDVESKKVVTRVARFVEGDNKVLPRVIAESVQELVQKSGL